MLQHVSSYCRLCARQQLRSIPGVIYLFAEYVPPYGENGLFEPGIFARVIIVHLIQNIYLNEYMDLHKSVNIFHIMMKLFQGL